MSGDVMDDYRRLADAVAAQIASGRLRPGDRLPPQRQFARRHRIAGSTAARVYGELIRRGLAVGEVGRGTFIRAAAPPSEPALAEPARARVDLELNFSVPPEQPALLAQSLDGMLRPDVLAGALAPMGAAGTSAMREAAAAMLSRPGWSPDPGHLRLAGNGRQAIAAALAALAPAGDRVGVEELTYPLVKGIAARLGIRLVPLAMDECGVLPEAIRSAGPLRAVYLQPTLHNPLGVTMPERRRSEIADALRDLGIYAVEDGIYTFLRDDGPAPLAAFAPDHVIVVDSLSKRVAPGLTVGFAVTPEVIGDRVASALRSGGWTAPRFAVEAATRWLTDGTVTALQELKRRDAVARQRLVREHLAEFAVDADPRAFHCWWRLPEPWRADTFVAAAARRGIAVTPGAAFTVVTAQAPNAVRLALSAPPIGTLAAALETLAALAGSAPDDAEIE
ncbi:PLP-dependent aminotransferase family protein [Actinoallomurus spadix]|uniref:PLP-dependent aminotransferase family protein n=1 Tax=Actinoallomurus spadix TaxID=79912 RepID=A0ABN0XQU0_9ACTN|nr:PLP-dependent aminotransferase family protein [Actinoallomurus spadix]MCO5988310.1 PLP-dependent aminotransferase family protein [Actinoallomurus spadix]